MSTTSEPTIPPEAVRQVQPRRAAAAPAALAAETDLLRFSTAGSVDDGKSTLIGRLLYDSKSIFEDQLRALDAASRRRGEALNLALLTDGLRAEREQNITIDVAYRYFATPRRKFIIADTPGHTQYTRNMVTGASNADLALILLDARKGVLTQSKRHAFISSLLGIPHFLIAVNKMDLVDYEEAAFREIVAEFTGFARKLEIKDVVFLPVSALHGDNVVERSRRMPWYEGATLLHHLETVNIAVDRNLLDFRFPVQYVIRAGGNYRGFAGRVASGTIRAGEEVVILPSRQATRIQTVENAEGPLAEAAAGDAAVLTMADERDISRGDMIVRRHNLPLIGTRFDAMLCWMAEAPLDPSATYVLQHTTRSTRASVPQVEYRVEVDTLHRQERATLEWNDIGRVRVTTAQPIFFDPFGRNPETGSFILVDPFTNVTVAAGMIRNEWRELPAVAAPVAASPSAVWAPGNIGREEREARNGHRAGVVWLTGLSGSGKTTLALALERRLFALGCQTVVLDGDQLRHGLCAGLGFSPEDRRENIRRASEAARLLFEHGHLVVCAFVSPFRQDREAVRGLVGAARFLEVFVDCDLEECRRRDPKGLYAAAGAGEVADLTGVGQAYEPPAAPDLIARTEQRSADELAEELLALLRARGWLR
ncbi:MAG TPA: adenylyl-sulfate kinase [Terriglobales bacterium]|nr:adenylyl-sulfate kinase [Terriglobales bacterium]